MSAKKKLKARRKEEEGFAKECHRMIDLYREKVAKIESIPKENFVENKKYVESVLRDIESSLEMFIKDDLVSRQLNLEYESEIACFKDLIRNGF